MTGEQNNVKLNHAILLEVICLEGSFLDKPVEVTRSKRALNQIDQNYILAVFDSRTECRKKPTNTEL